LTAKDSPLLSVSLKKEATSIDGLQRVPSKKKKEFIYIYLRNKERGIKMAGHISLISVNQISNEIKGFLLK